MSGSKIIARLLCLTFISVSCINTSEQTLVNSTGNTIKNNLYSFEYSVGEIAITTISNKTNNATQGLLQPAVKDSAAQAFRNKDLIFEKIKFRSFNSNPILKYFTNRKPWYTNHWLFTKDHFSINKTL